MTNFWRHAQLVLAHSRPAGSCDASVGWGSPWVLRGLYKQKRVGLGRKQACCSLLYPWEGVLALPTSFFTALWWGYRWNDLEFPFQLQDTKTENWSRKCCHNDPWAFKPQKSMLFLALRHSMGPVPSGSESIPFTSRWHLAARDVILHPAFPLLMLLPTADSK